MQKITVFYSFFRIKILFWIDFIFNFLFFSAGFSWVSVGFLIVAPTYFLSFRLNLLVSKCFFCIFYFRYFYKNIAFSMAVAF